MKLTLHCQIGPVDERLGHAKWGSTQVEFIPEHYGEGAKMVVIYTEPGTAEPKRLSARGMSASEVRQLADGLKALLQR